MKFLKLLVLFTLIVCNVSAQLIYRKGTASGTDTYTVTVSPTFTVYYEDQRFLIEFTNANTGASTINVNSKGAVSLVKEGGTALAANDIKAGEIKLLVYDGTNMQVVGGGGMSVASESDVLTGTNDTKAITPLKLRNSSLNADIFYAEDYGAVADGSGTTGNGTDNLSAINSAIAALNANGKGTLRFGAGIYRFTGTLNTITASNVVFEGMGMGVTTLFCDNTTVNSSGIINTGNYTHYRNFTFKGRETFQSSGVGITVRGNGSSIDHVEVTEANCFSIYLNSGTDQSVTNCYIHDSAADGIHVSINAIRAKVSNNTIYNCADDGIGIGFEGAASSIVVSNNIIYQTSAGIAVMGYSASGVSADVNNITVAGNTIYQTWLAGVLLHMTQGSLKNVTVSGNTIDRAGGWSSTAGVAMRGSGVPGGVVIYSNSSNTLRTLTNVTIEGNTITDAKNYFVAVGISNNGGVATNGIVRDVKVSSNNCSGILAGSGATASWTGGAQQTTATPGNYPGIMAAYTTGNLAIENNQIKGSWNGAVRVSVETASGLVVVRNNHDISGNTGGGIWISAYAFAIASTNPAVIVDMEGNVTLTPVNAYTGGISILSIGSTVLNFKSSQDTRNPQSGTTYTVLARDVNKVIALTNTAARAITMPAASTYQVGASFSIVDEAGTAAAANITMTRAGSDTINGATTSVISTNYGARTYYSNGSNAWFVR